jgi:uncharacterized protein (TIGR02246 family)
MSQQMHEDAAQQMQVHEDTAQQLRRVAQDWVTAELRGDTAALGGILADDFVGIGPLGFMLTKEEWIQRHQSGVLRYTSLTLEDVQVRVYGDAAILTGRETQTATYGGQDIPGEFRATLIWVRQQGRWRLAGQQLSALGQPPGPPRS